MNTQTNPFEPPRAEIEPLAEAGVAGELRAEPRRLPAGRGSAWIGGGWELFKSSPWTWIGMAVVYFAMIFVANQFPGWGNWAATWLLPLFLAGWIVACHRAHTREGPKFNDLFAGFRLHFGPLALASLIYVAVSVAASIAIGLIATALGGSVWITLSGDVGNEPWGGMSGSSFMLVMLLSFLVHIPIYMLIWFTPALIAIHRVPPMQAMGMSLRGCLKNILPLLVFTLLCVLVLTIGLIALLVGTLVAVPVVYCALYPAYRDIFVEF